MRILWLKTEFLHPVDKGGRIRTYHMLRAIAEEHRVTYLTLDDGTADATARSGASEYAAEVIPIPFAPPAKSSPAFYGALAANLLSPLPYAVERYRSAAMQARVAELAPRHDVVVCDFLAPAVNMPAQLAVPTVLFQHNVEAMIWERHASVPQHPVRRAYMASQWRRMRRFESAACRRFDHVIAVSPEDAEIMRQAYAIRSVSSVPTGVDVAYFTAPADVARRPAELVFTGSMDWMPNDDAMGWFLDDILPRVRAEVPECTVTIVGRSPSTKLRERAESLGGVTVTGRVDDVRPYLAQGTVFVVPIRVGGGTRLKIFEGMASGLPVVSTTIGAEGLPLEEGTHLLRRDTAAEFGSAVVELLRQRSVRESLAARGMGYVRERFGWQGVARQFIEQCNQVVPSTGRAHAHPSLSMSAS